MTSIRSAIVAGFALAAGSLAGGAVGDAAAQTKEFRGNSCIISATAACGPAGWSVGNCGTSRYRPPNWNGNPNRTQFSIFWGSYFGNSIATEGSILGAVFKPVVHGGTSGGTYFYDAGTTARIAGQVPATLAPATALVSNVVYINKFEGVAGCNIAIRFTGQRYPLP